MKGSSGFWFLSVLFFLISESTFVHGKYNKVKLKDVEVLTLVEGRMTTGRRSSPVPQFTCIGGSCNAFTPNIIQCYNRGSDGVDVQWECKAEMDNNYRFGKVEVTCEGYDYPDDPYILAGSCGLEYTIERMDGSGGKSWGREEKTSKYNTKQSSNGFGTWMFIGVVGVVLYAFYKTCIAPNEHVNARSRTSDDFSGRPPPPPPGFRQDYYPNSGSGGSGGGGGGFFGGGSSSNDFGDSCGAGTRPNYQGTRTQGAGANLPGAGGFWTGAATGGLLGYMFGARNNDGRGAGYMPRTTPSGSGGWFGGSGGGGSSSSAGSSSGSRTASGFGGTKRR